MRRTGFVGDRSGHQVWLVAALLVVVLLLAGCGPRIGTTAPPQAADDALVVDLPMIYIDFDADGQATLGGIPVSELGAALGSDLSSISMEPDTVARLQNANLQHVQLATRPDGVAIFINSAPAPSLVWDEQTLESLVATLNDLGTDLGEAGALLPLVRDFGLNLALRFPAAAGKSEIPVTADSKAVDALATTDLQGIINSAAALNLQLNYAADGSFALEGINPLMAGMIQGPLQQAALKPEQLESVAELGINSVGLKVLQGGILISINGKPLPFLKFANEGELFGLLDLVTAMQGDDGGALAALKGPLQQLLPILTNLGVSLTVNFPG
ncbi:MAG: hypothetical protein KDD78_03920 [Caldilineaceae bacterium]|nr:hypothetical protein [Caldilineaceae bacterium]